MKFTNSLSTLREKSFQKTNNMITKQEVMHNRYYAHLKITVVANMLKQFSLILSPTLLSSNPLWRPRKSGGTGIEWGRTASGQWWQWLQVTEQRYKCHKEKEKLSTKCYWEDWSRIKCKGGTHSWLITRMQDSVMKLH